MKKIIQAFPARSENGMTLRDFFAACSLIGIRSRTIIPSSEVANDAFKDADAMLKAREL